MASGKKKTKTAAELMAELESDPEFVAKRDERERNRLEIEKDLRLKQKPLLQALESVGVRVSSVWDLVNADAPYPEAIPVLLEWLPKVADERIKEGVVRALTIKSAGAEVARALILEFEDSEPKSQEQEMTKWAMGNAISEVATPAFVQDLLRLARDKRHGAARQMLAIAIGKKGKKSRKESIDVLVELLDDPDLQGQALAGLGYLKAKEARKSIEPFLDHDNAWIRKEAKKALRKCED